LKRFYKYHFIGRNPDDVTMTLVSRTVRTDTLVDESIFKFIHTSTIDRMLPGIPPTGKAVEIPMVAVVHFRGGKLVHEHIYWDQASVLVQIGKLDPAGLPVAGAPAPKAGSHRRSRQDMRPLFRRRSRQWSRRGG